MNVDNFYKENERPAGVTLRSKEVITFEQRDIKRVEAIL